MRQFIVECWDSVMNPIKLSLLVVTFVASVVVDVKAIDKNSDDEFWNEIKQKQR